MIHECCICKRYCAAQYDYCRNSDK